MPLLTDRVDSHNFHSENRSRSNSDQKDTFGALLNITSAAVEALEKPHTPQRFDSVPQQKTRTQARSQSKKSDDVSPRSASSTASDVLIRATNKDQDPLNLSGASKASDRSKSSAASSTFLTGEAQRVKVPSKKLTEIKSPFEEAKELKVGAGNLGFLQMLDTSSFQSSLLSDVGQQTDVEKETSYTPGNGGKEGEDPHADLAHVGRPSSEAVANGETAARGRRISDISVNVVKHHFVRKHTTEHNHSVVVERHKGDADTSLHLDSGKETTVKDSVDSSSGLDSGYQTKHLPVQALYSSQTLKNLKTSSGPDGNPASDIEGKCTKCCSSQWNLFDFACTILN